AWLTTPDVPLALAQLAERFYGSPSSKLKLIGVTGTNGKTSIVHLVQQLLGAAGCDCGQISTVSVRDGKGWARASMTTPPALELSYSLSTMVEAGFGAVAIEVSSHGLDQKRTAALEFDAAIFTNLTGDHQDYHGSMEAYLAAKAQLFESLSPDAVAIVNIDDPNADRMVERSSARVLRCSIESHPAADCSAQHGPWRTGGVQAQFMGPWGEVSGTLGLLGRFNLLNVLQSIAAAYVAGVSMEGIERALSTLIAPAGRLERVAIESNDEPTPRVYVDYAHTDDALRHCLRFLRKMTRGRVICVFGAGGDRDKTKRPLLGRAGAEADLSIITSDNPRTENPDEIIKDILSGFPTSSTGVLVEADRRQAIQRAVEQAEPGDCVLVAGKGHETYQTVGMKRIPFDDVLVVREALENRLQPAGFEQERLGA
ncbi:MAG: UDP-N-acetylmuramoyl-L-alanyl-D-glutamate--2,6-diaminopimelate ligase, partial [Planctomycetes bacterium]|nr:UDP-N-acetylmuramoyl-L-alanyl-D-glutamate--2,6-diaminopimelate ligase [Planctomycetota bacterium]